MNYGESSLKIEASYWGDKEISYSEIEDMEYRNHYVKCNDYVILTVNGKKR